jgi:multicomponent K+:H+ antiporter subunit E
MMTDTTKSEPEAKPAPAAPDASLNTTLKRTAKLPAAEPLKARRWFPHTALSIFMLVLWLLLVNEVSVGQLVLGAFLAWLIPWWTQAFWPEYLRLQHPEAAVRFILFVLWDVVRANLILAKRILSPHQKLQPGFLVVPLDIEHQFTITILASAVSLGPGTVSADLNVEGHYLLVHSIHISDTEAAIADIKRRYEAPLKEIFECSTTP